MDKEKIVELVKSNRYYSEYSDLNETVVDTVVTKIEDISNSISDDFLLEKLTRNIVNKTYKEIIDKKNNIPALNNNDNFLNKLSEITVTYHFSDSILKQVYKNIRQMDENDNITILSQVFDLKYKEKLSNSEIAKYLKISEDSVVEILFEISDIVNKVANNELSKM